MRNGNSYLNKWWENENDLKIHSYIQLYLLISKNKIKKLDGWMQIEHKLTNKRYR